MRSGLIQEIDFNEDEHTYTYRGTRLNGITTIIAKRLGKEFPDNARTQLACSYGSQVHKESETWIKEGTDPITDSGKWVVDTLKSLMMPGDTLLAELRVSDFEGTASNVDIVLENSHKDNVYLFDIKTGNFDRQYCTMQLNAYRMMYENCYEPRVMGMMVLCTKTKRAYKICKTDDADTLELLEANKNV